MPAQTVFTKEMIIDAAFKIACEEGFEHMTIRHIAKRMGSSIAPIYVNFNHVEELKHAVMEKAQRIYHEMILDAKHEDPFLRYAIASMAFNKKYPKIYQTFLLDEDDPISSEKNVKKMMDTILNNEQYNTLDKDSVMKFIISMQALQVGLSIMSKKSYYASFLSDEDMIHLMDDLGEVVMSSLLKRNNEKKSN